MTNCPTQTCTAVLAMSFFALGHSADAGSFVTFNPPGSTRTLPLTINSHDTVAGYFFDSTGRTHGFVRIADGTITTLDAPRSSDTQVWAMNDRGWIVGEFKPQGTRRYVCFVRRPNGHFKTFKFGASDSYCVATGINNSNTVTGFYGTLSGTVSGFVDVEGTFTTFDVSGALDTAPTAINDDGTITGNYEDSSYKAHGFVRSSDGTIVTFDPSGSIQTLPNAINAAGIVVGNYLTQTGSRYAFARAPDGTITTLQYGRGDTSVSAIDKEGRITGAREANGQQMGFVRSPDGSEVHKIHPDGALPTSINNHRAMTGQYQVDGFIRLPD